jgi:hypothetical protein
MTDRTEPLPLLQGLHKPDYDIHSLDDEIRVDRLCIDLLRHLYQDLTARAGMPAARAGAICRGADHFLREFIIGDRRENLFSLGAHRIRQFAGHWYIIRTPEPSIEELHHILAGTAEFYRFLARQKLVEADLVEGIVRLCGELDYYRRRIEDFWAIENGGYDAWRLACPLEPAPERS